MLVSFLCWQVSQAPNNLNTMPLGNIARSSVTLALPLILGSLAGVLCERSAVINVAIEGQFLMGAFAAAMFATLAASVWVGIIAAAIGGLLIAALLAVLSIRYLVDQVVLGIVLNVLRARPDRLPLRAADADRTQTRYNQPPRLPQWEVPRPVGDPDARAGAVQGQHLRLRRLRPGLRRSTSGSSAPGGACGPGRSASTRPPRTRSASRCSGCATATCCVGGLIAGFGGAYFTLLSTTNFNKNMTVGPRASSRWPR